MNFKMNMITSTLLAAGFSLLAGTAAAQTCVANNCAALGFTKSASNCEGDIIRCPFDTSKVFCKEKKVYAPKPGDIVLKKSKYSFFYGTDLLNILTTIGIKTVICTGVCTDCCVFSTARDAGQYNFDVGLLSDFTGTVAYSDPRFGTFSAEEVKNCFLATMAISTADIMTSGELLSRFV